MPRQRLRDLGIQIGNMSPGAHNAITDVSGVRVGHTTLIIGYGALQPGIGPVRTGVSIVLPHGGNLFQEKVRAAVHTINGTGKTVGFEQVRELGLIESPIALTNTLNIGLVMDALISHAIHHNPQIGIRPHGTVNVVVGETNDGDLNDIQGRHVKAEHVWSAIENADTGRVQEGAVGAGTGTICMGWKGGIGTASRVLPEIQGGYTLGALVQSNFGRPDDLMVAGIPVGKLLKPADVVEDNLNEGGSVVIVLATDAPLSSRQLERLCKRTPIGLGHVGSHLGQSSGDFVIAFTTAARLNCASNARAELLFSIADDEPAMSFLMRAVVECVEEAVLNSLCCAETMTGRDGNVALALPLDKLADIVSGYHSSFNA